MRKTFMALGLTVPIMLGCISATGVEIGELEGSWVATHIAFVNVNDVTATADLFATGLRATMDIGPTGAFTLVFERADGTVDVRTGVMTVDGQDVVWILEDETVPGEVFLENDQVSFQMLGGAAEDFDGDGKLDRAQMNLVLDRVSS